MFVLKNKMKCEHTERRLNETVEAEHRGEEQALTGGRKSPLGAEGIFSNGVKAGKAVEIHRARMGLGHASLPRCAGSTRKQ